MTNPTLERAARALWFERGGSWFDASDRQKQQCVYEARAVLMALLPDAPTKSMAESVAHDDEGTFEPLHDLIGFSGENKTRTVLRQAWIEGIQAILNDGEGE